jgi:hypothetical protein
VVSSDAWFFRVRKNVRAV